MKEESKTKNIDELMRDWIDRIPELLEPNSKFVLLSIILSLKKRNKKTVKTLDVLKEYLAVLDKAMQEDLKKNASVNVEHGLKRLKEMGIVRVVSYTEWRYKLEYDIDTLSDSLKKDPLLSPFLN